MIHRPGFVLLGIGLATLVCAGKGGCIEVEDGLEDVRIGGVLLEAGVTDLSRPTQPMLRWGRSTTPSPGGLLSDVHARLTAMPSIPALSPSESSADLNHLHPLPLPPLEGCSPKRADVMLQLSSSGLTLDHSWLWHADHDQCAGANASECSLPYRGTCVSDACVSSHGLLVDGNGVSAYGLQVEHHKKTLVVWRGRGGRTFMFQAEVPQATALAALQTFMLAVWGRENHPTSLLRHSCLWGDSNRLSPQIFMFAGCGGQRSASDHLFPLAQSCMFQASVGR